MAKRIASSDLNQDNWDDEEDSENPGTFQQAKSSILQSRVIKTAKRRSVGSPAAKKSPFSGFSGFGSKTDPSPSSPFSFLSQPVGNNNKEAKDNATNSSTLNSVKPFENIFKNTNSQSNVSEEKNNKGLQFLKDLNTSCSKWIMEHVQKDPYCILTPVFKDYEKYLSKLNLDTKNNEEKGVVIDPDSKGTQLIVSSEENPTNAFNNNQKSEFKLPTFGLPTNNLITSTSSGFSFGNSANTSFSFGKEVTKQVDVESAAKADGDNGNDDNGESEKYELKRVVESDSLFNIRCKVFVKKESDYVSRGIGMLYLKKVKDTDKVQLLVRADTNLGNILLNVLLTPSLPIEKAGKNNIMLICLPTPDSKPPPTAVLIRLKDSEDRDTVIKKIEEHRGS